MLACEALENATAELKLDLLEKKPGPPPIVTGRKIAVNLTNLLNP